MRRADALLLLCVTLWGSNFVFASMLAQEFSPLCLAALRLTISVMVLGIYGFITGRITKLRWQDWKQIFPLAIMAILLHHSTFFIGLKDVDSTTAALIIALVPMTTAILAAFFLKETFTIRKSTGTILALIGVYFVIGFRNSLHFNWGLIWIFISMIAFSISVIQTRKLAEKLDPFIITIYSNLIGTSMFIPVVFAFESKWHLSDQFWAWGLLLLSAIVIQAICSLIWSYQIKVVGASRAANYINLEPFIAMVVGFIIWGTSVNLVQLIGSMILISGVMLVTTSKPRMIKA